MACKPCEERRKLIKNAIKSKLLMLKLKSNQSGVENNDFRALPARKAGNFHK